MYLCLGCLWGKGETQEIKTTVHKKAHEKIDNMIVGSLENKCQNKIKTLNIVIKALSVQPLAL